jgi:ketosteroid isomerase-like protein
MSRENVELVRSVHPPSGTDLTVLFGGEDAGRGGLGRLAPLLTDDFEVVGGDHFGDLGLTSDGRGVEGLVSVWREWLSPWETYRTEVEDFLDAGEDRVVVLIRDRGRLRESDSEVELVSASVWTLRDGKIARIEFHTSRPQAFRAAGLED